MAATQRPILQSALAEPSGSPAWRQLPSWFIYGELDKNIPATMHAFMAKRAGAREAIEVKGASHVVMISHPHDVAALIERAAVSGE
jgi:pimeloyl-ACP methyl ester carboxylesterase